MGFWLYCTGMDLLVPLVMIYFGRRFLTKPPKYINGWYGYRTTRSMKNQQTWDFAHQVCGKVWFRVGLVLLPVSFLLLLPVLGKDVDVVGMWCAGVMGMQVVVMIASIVPVERALKKQFDEFGRKR